MMSLRCSRFLHSRSPLPNPLRNTQPSYSPFFHPNPQPFHRNASTKATLSRLIAPKVLSKNTSAAYYATAVLIAFLGLTYASVPIYRIVCAKTGWGGTPMTDSTKFSAEHMVPVPTASGRRIKVSFSASTSDSLPWSFRPQQREISILPGETALAFYKAKNKSSEDIIGIATYNVSPLSLSVCYDYDCFLPFTLDKRLYRENLFRGFYLNVFEWVCEDGGNGR
jgi:cytochrome c oxidase assembly protein Cox11